MRIDDANRWTRTSYSKNYTVFLIYYYIYIYNNYLPENLEKTISICTISTFTSIYCAQKSI